MEITYQDLKKGNHNIKVIAKVINNNFDEVLKDIALNKQWKVAKELDLQPSYLSIIITTLKATKGL